MAFNAGTFSPGINSPSDPFYVPPLSEGQQRRADRAEEHESRARATRSWLNQQAQAQIMRDKRRAGKPFDISNPNDVTDFFGFDPRNYSIERIKMGAPMGVLGQGLPPELLKQFSNDDIIQMGKSMGDLEGLLGRLDVDRLRTFPAHVVAGMLARNEEHMKKNNFGPAIMPPGDPYVPGVMHPDSFLFPNDMNRMQPQYLPGQRLAPLQSLLV